VPTGSHLQSADALEHKLILTGVPGSNGRRLRVRCKCMAEYRDVSDRYYNYDPLGEVSSLDDAITMYHKHLEES
jgi:hypothetical protein